MVTRRPPTPQVMRRRPPVPGIPIPGIPLPPIPGIGIEWADVDSLRPQIDFHTGEERIHRANLPDLVGGGAQHAPRDGDDPPGANHRSEFAERVDPLERATEDHKVRRRPRGCPILSSMRRRERYAWCRRSTSCSRGEITQELRIACDNLVRSRAAPAGRRRDGPRERSDPSGDPLREPLLLHGAIRMTRERCRRR